ncbi:hypothetical protein LTS14_003475 [Recurvomyces mirabilis]|uniref:uncharacterized protein n=1 Tax=Recurvomyces mirabilis TaxID=574656 RepID=UPI002DDEAE56|nr:hypothetical protein LTS14_003475 [Recurvomyces mirabilis]
MKFYLIRHGETVDNIVSLYAGVRDSALTVHGIEQARRLGDYFAKNDVKLTHIFASPLQRAFKTAEAVRDAQVKLDGGSGGNGDGDRDGKARVEIVKVPDLIEQDFGFYEGKSFFARSGAKKSGREGHYDKHRNDPGFVDVESRESMCQRADAFLDQHLLPLMLAQSQGADPETTIAVVSHGMLLASLWRRLLLRLPRKSLRIAPEVTTARGPVVLEHLGGWSNTGYLELELMRGEVKGTLQPASEKDVPNTELPTLAIPPSIAPADVSAPTRSTPVPPPAAAEEAEGSSDSEIFATSSTALSAPSKALSLAGWSTAILAVDSKEHLVGFKRQRGGIGRIAHDEGQKKLDGFFKRQKKG